MGYIPGRTAVWSCWWHAVPGLRIESDEESRDKNGMPVRKMQCYAADCVNPGVVKLRWVPDMPTRTRQGCE